MFVNIIQSLQLLLSCPWSVWRRKQGGGWVRGRRQHWRREPQRQARGPEMTATQGPETSRDSQAEATNSHPPRGLLTVTFTETPGQEENERMKLSK